MKSGDDWISLELPGETVDVSTQDLCAMLVDTGAVQEYRTRLGVDLCHLRLGGDAIANVDRGEEIKIHLGSQEGPQPTQVGEQTGSQQTWHDAVLKLGVTAVQLIGVQRVDIPGGANEQGDIRFSEGASEGDFIPQRGGANGSFGKGGPVHGD